MFKNKNILITGGTGSFGKKFVKIFLKRFKPKKLIVYSRDELKQYEMKHFFRNYTCLRFFLGDVRDKDRLKFAFDVISVNYYSLTQIFTGCEKKLRLQRPPSVPTPLSFTPPNGTRKSR